LASTVNAELSRVTIVAPATRVDLALPANVPLATLLPTLLRYAGEELPDDPAAQAGWVLTRLGGRVLEELMSNVESLLALADHARRALERLAPALGALADAAAKASVRKEVTVVIETAPPPAASAEDSLAEIVADGWPSLARGCLPSMIMRSRRFTATC